MPFGAITAKGASTPIPKISARSWPGHALHRLARDRLLIKVAAQCVLIAARITACAEQYRTCYRAYRSLSDAFHGIYPLLISRDASFYRLRKTAYRMQEIAKCALQLLVEVFQLSMCYMDALAALSFSAETQDDAIKELFATASVSSTP